MKIEVKSEMLADYYETDEHLIDTCDGCPPYIRLPDGEYLILPVVGAADLIAQAISLHAKKFDPETREWVEQHPITVAKAVVAALEGTES